MPLNSEFSSSLMREIRQNRNKFEQGCEKKGIKIDFDRIIELDDKTRELRTKLENLRARRNELSKLIAGEITKSVN